MLSEDRGEVKVAAQLPGGAELEEGDVVAEVNGKAVASLDDYRGLAKRSPALAGALAILMLAMGGIPLTAGFVGKVGVFASAIDAGYLWLAIVGLVMLIIGIALRLRRRWFAA